MDQQKLFRSGRTPQVFSDAFKLEVVRDYLSSGLSKEAIARKYGIRSHSGVQRWLHQFGYAAPNAEMINFKDIIPADLSKKKATSTHSGLSAQEQIRQLKKQLEDEQLRSEMYLRMIEIAETQYHIPVRKKPDTK